MYKIYYQGDQDDLLAQCSGILSQFVRTDGLYKQAASSCFPASVISENKPDDDHFMMHLVAMGSWPRYMPNRNGDAFTRESLLNTHDTFVKFAKLYREHAHHDPDKNLGFVKASAYNEDLDRVELLVHGNKRKAEEAYETAKKGGELSFSMACFPAGTPVTIPDGTTIPIEELDKGSEVITHKGNVGQVGEILSREYTGKMITISAFGLHSPLVSTEEHPIWARVNMRATAPCPVCGEKFKHLKSHLRQKKDPQHQKANKDYSRSTEGFWPAHYLSPNDFVRTGVPRLENNSGNEALAKVVGYYLAEGSLTMALQKYNSKVTGEPRKYESPRIEWTFGPGETDMANEVADAVVALGYTRPYINTPKTCNKIRVFSTNRHLYDWLLKNCGKLSHAKKLSREVMEWSPSLQKIILAKWLEGDGTWSKMHQHVSGVTVSENLANQLLVLASRCGIPAAVSKSSRKAPRRCVYNFLVTNSEAIETLSGWTTKVPDNRRDKHAAVTRGIANLKHQTSDSTALIKYSEKRAHIYVENGFIYRRIRKVKESFTTCAVYDLHVPGDHGFHAGGMGVSNCKLPHDQCSVCGNKASSMSKHCTHLKNHMNQYVPEFRKYAFAFNPDPKFFDISLVRRPADRIAHYLEYVFGEDKDSLTKAASDRDNGKLVISGAEWAKYAGYSDDRVSYPEDFSTMVEYLADKERWVSEVDGSSALNPAVRFVNDVIKKAQVKANTELPSGLASLLPATLFHKLASNGVIIPFDMFCAYIEDKSLDEVRKDPEFIKASSELPYMFRALQKTAPNEELVKIANSFRPQDEWVVNSLLFDNGLVQNEIVKLANDFSSDLSGIQGRALYSIKKSSWNEGTPTDSLSALPYAYACYQTHMLMHSKDLDISSLYAIGGNRFAAEKS